MAAKLPVPARKRALYAKRAKGETADLAAADYGVSVAVRLPKPLYDEVVAFQQRCIGADGTPSMGAIIRMLLAKALKQKRPKP